MDIYEYLLDEADINNLKVYENVEFNQNLDGLIVNDRIALSDKLETSSQKKCVLAEELAHHYVNNGDILGLDISNNRYQENKAHRYAIDLILSIEVVIKAIIDLKEEATLSTVAERLDVTEEFLSESFDLYSKRFDGIIDYQNYFISFNPIHVWQKD